VNVHRLKQTINGREYLIEVRSVGGGKWRAQIARVPGGSAALMPFYGTTPDEAAGLLSRWLAIAHGVTVRVEPVSRSDGRNGELAGKRL
jgi:hypothetical protein